MKFSQMRERTFFVRDCYESLDRADKSYRIDSILEWPWHDGDECVFLVEALIGQSWEDLP